MRKSELSISVVLIAITMLVSCNQTGKDVSGDKFPVPQIPFQPKNYVCYQTGTPIKIDGKIQEDSWQQATWTDDFVDIEGELKPLPRFQTRVKMLWDDIYFYVAAEMEEPDVWARLTKRDTVIYYDNDFEVFIDPDGDTHQYYELEINAFGTEWDLFLDKPYRDDARAMFFWDIAGLKSAVHVNGTINTPGDKDVGWTLEVAIPWKVLKECANKPSPPGPGDQWRVNFSRVEWQTEVNDGKYQKIMAPKTDRPLPENNWVWSPQGLIAMHYPEMWGYVQFSEAIAGEREDTFVALPEEAAKWALREIYYGQKELYLRYGRFTNDITKLGTDFTPGAEYQWPPKIQCSDHQYEASLVSEDDTHRWIIMQDGKVWREGVKK